MARYELKNEGIAIGIESHGAELKSLRRVDTGMEYLWRADPAFWGRTSPILFPFVGSVYNKEYRTKGKTYTMAQHGFARDMEFELLSKTEGKEIWFGLKDSQITREKYPYGFDLKVGYRLLACGVEVCWRVENPGNEELPFSIGGHPAFNCPLNEGERKTDYQLWFDAKEKIVSTKISKNGLATDEKVAYPLTDGYLSVTEHLFDEDALVIEHGQAKEVALCLPGGEPYLRVVMEAPLFGVWSPPKKNAPFICIEPWYGRCDHEGFEGDLKEREWGNLLSPRQTWEASYQILV